MAKRYTVQEVGAKWLQSDVTKAQSSIDRDESTLRLHIYPHLGHAPVRRVKPGTIQELVNSWVGSARTIRRQYATVRAVFNFAESYEWVPKSPCRHIKLPEATPSERRPLTDADVVALADAVGEGFREAILIGALAGLRWNEVFGLRLEDLDVGAATLRVRRGLERSKTGASVRGKVGSRKARPRTECIPQWLADLLDARISQLGEDQRDAPLFPDSGGGLVRYTNWRKRIWLPALEAAGLSGVQPRPGFHDLRRYHTSVLVANGTDPRTLVNRLGHTTARLALEVYAQPDLHADRIAAQQTGDRVFNAMSHVGRTPQSRHRGRGADKRS